jgi:hypothetical protein
MPDPNCLNCDKRLPALARFCPGCGQRTDTARLSMGDVLRDLMHSFVNIERSPLAFAWALISRPGAMAREHVQGRRRRYYGPFATLAVLVGATALVVNLSGYQVLARDGFDPAPTDLLQRHFNLLQLAQVPLLGGCCAFLFRAARLNFFEHMVLAAYALSMRAALLLVVASVSMLTSAAVPSQASVYLYWVVWFSYFGWAGAQFYGGRRGAAWAKATAAAVLAHATVVGLILAGNRTSQLLAAWL